LALPLRSVSAPPIARGTPQARLAALKHEVRAAAENRPGVYTMHAEDGEVLYVGKSKSLRTRLLSYFRCSFPHDKGARLIREAHRLDWRYEPSEFAALLRELELIKRFRPRFNVVMKRDAHHYAFIKLTRGPAPRLLAVRGAGEDAASYFGPYYGLQRIGDAVRELNDVLGLRDCSSDSSMRFSDQDDLFAPVSRTPGCIRFEVGKCLGPCIAACTSSEYSERVAIARAFLEGNTDEPLILLRDRMLQLSEQMQFERAGLIRDKLRRLEELRTQFLEFRVSIESLTFVYLVSGFGGEDRVYLIRRGLVRREIAVPRTPLEQEWLRHASDEVFSPPERATAQVAAHEIDELMLVASWFRRAGELGRTIAPGEPLPETSMLPTRRKTRGRRA
jgi:excinuclease ABC subunit C